MKTGHEYLKELPKDVQEKFLANLRKAKDAKEYLDDVYDSFYYFISDSFEWETTPQKHEYWENIANSNIPTIKSDWSIESYFENKESDVITKDEAKLLIEVINKYYVKR